MTRKCGSLAATGVLRPAHRVDLPQIITIYNHTISSRQVTADLEPVTPEQRQAWYDCHTDRRPLYVLERDDAILAWFSFGDFYGRPAYAGTAEISIYLHPDWQGIGLGDLIIRAAQDMTTKLEIHTLVGFVFSHNLPSLALLKKHGFVHWGELPDIAMMDDKPYSLTILGWQRDL